MSFPSSWLQSVNSVFVIIGAPLFAAIWMFLSKRGKEPSSPAKFGTALVLVASGSRSCSPPRWRSTAATSR